MAHGCVPITSRYKHSTLPELTEPFDLGPRPLSPDHERDGDWGPWVALWEESVVAASLRAQEGDNLRAHRDAMVAAAANLAASLPTSGAGQPVSLPAPEGG